MRNFNYWFVFSSIGLILMIESSFMLISAFVGEIYNESAVTSLYLSALATFISGLTLSLIGRKRRKEKRISQQGSLPDGHPGWF